MAFEGPGSVRFGTSTVALHCDSLAVASPLPPDCDRSGGSEPSAPKS